MDYICSLFSCCPSDTTIVRRYLKYMAHPDDGVRKTQFIALIKYLIEHPRLLQNGRFYNQMNKLVAIFLKEDKVYTKEEYHILGDFMFIMVKHV